MVKLNEIIEANNLLISLGGEDQLQNIAAIAIERSLELQNRIDQAIEYANSSTSNSTHAKNMAGILLNGTIPTTEEVKSVEEKPKKVPQNKGSQKTPPRRRGGLVGRPRAERQAFRKWAAEQGLTVPNAGPVPQDLIDTYDKALKEPTKTIADTPTDSEPPM